MTHASEAEGSAHAGSRAAGKVVARRGIARRAWSWRGRSAPRDEDFSENAWRLVVELADAVRREDAQGFLDVTRSSKSRFTLFEQNLASVYLMVSLRTAVRLRLTREPYVEDLLLVAEEAHTTAAISLRVSADELFRALMTAHEIEYAGDQVEGARFAVLAAATLGALLRLPSVEIDPVRVAVQEWWALSAATWLPQMVYR